MDETLIQFAMKEISLHLSRNPLSADTLEGIHLWWISWPDIQESIFITAEALNRLEDAQQLEHLTISEREVWRAVRK